MCVFVRASVSGSICTCTCFACVRERCLRALAKCVSMCVDRDIPGGGGEGAGSCAWRDRDMFFRDIPGGVRPKNLYVTRDVLRTLPL